MNNTLYNGFGAYTTYGEGCPNKNWLAMEVVTDLQSTHPDFEEFIAEKGERANTCLVFLPTSEDRLVVNRLKIVYTDTNRKLDGGYTLTSLIQSVEVIDGRVIIKTCNNEYSFIPTGEYLDFMPEPDEPLDEDINFDDGFSFI